MTDVIVGTGFMGKPFVCLKGEGFSCEKDLSHEELLKLITDAKAAMAASLSYNKWADHIVECMKENPPKLYKPKGKKKP